MPLTEGSPTYLAERRDVLRGQRRAKGRDDIAHAELMAHDDIEPFRGLLLALFFMGIGMGIDLRLVWANLGLILGLAVLALALTAINMFGGFAVTRRMLAMFRK